MESNLGSGQRSAFSTPILLTSTLVALASMLWSCGRNQPGGTPAKLQEAWDDYNNPLRLNGRYNFNFIGLPTQGTATTTPWSDTYWPNFLGGIAQRWYGAPSDGFSYALIAQSAATALTGPDLAQLSPAEKYDIYEGNFDYPLVTSERQRTHASDPSWYGLCHGWAPAAINFAEPKPVTLKGPSGIAIEFGSSDVKALLTYAQQWNRGPTDVQMVGQRCNSDISGDPDAANSAACRDVNAGAFHVILANELGLDNAPFVADIARDQQVWNQPVFAYKSQILGDVPTIYASAAPGTTRIVQVKTTMYYVDESSPNWNAIPAANFPQEISTNDYQYTLELNASGEIIGGEWSEYDRPDFVWRETAPTLTGYLQDIGTIYAASIASSH